jgi:hypothetical protein
MYNRALKTALRMLYAWEIRRLVCFEREQIKVYTFCKKKHTYTSAEASVTESESAFYHYFALARRRVRVRVHRPAFDETRGRH